MSFRLPLRKGLAAVATLFMLAGLASCGGGGQVVPFDPDRIVAFGDELSVIRTDGTKYSINAFRITDSTTNPPTESTTETAAWARPPPRRVKCWPNRATRWPTCRRKLPPCKVLRWASPTWPW